MRLIHNNQRGITLIELLIAVGITGIITAAITMSIFQVYAGNARSSNHMIAVKQVQNAGYWISRDAQMAKRIDTNPTDDPLTQGTDFLVLGWVGWEYPSAGNTRIDTYEVRYSHDADTHYIWCYKTITSKEYDSDGKLVDPQPDPQNLTSRIAGHINPIPERSMDDNKLVVTVTASVGDAQEVRTYEITPRPST